MVKWKGPVFYTTVGALAASLIMTATPALASQNYFKTFAAYLEQDGQVVSKPPAIAYDGTSYFGIWWIQDQLKKDGIDVSWDGKTLSLTNMPVQQTDSLTVSNANSSTVASPIFANTINVNGVTYLPLSEVQDLLTQAGSQFEFKTGNNDGQSSDSQDGQASNSNFENAIHKLKNINEKLSEYQSEDNHGDSENAHLSSFASSLIQLQSVIDQLNKISSSSTSTSGSTTTAGQQTTSNSTSNSSTNGTQPSIAIPTLSTIISGLQSDWHSLNTIALQNIANQSGTSNQDLSSIISDIKSQISALSSLEPQQNQNGNSHQDNSSGQDN